MFRGRVGVGVGGLLFCFSGRVMWCCGSLVILLCWLVTSFIAFFGKLVCFLILFSLCRLMGLYLGILLLV